MRFRGPTPPFDGDGFRCIIQFGLLDSRAVRTCNRRSGREWRPITSNKHELLASLREVFRSWEKLLAAKSEEDITARRGPEDWSISDVIAHLTAWQQVSIARLEAALLETEPEFPAWLAGADPFCAEDNVDDFNSRIYRISRGQSWSSVYRDWTEGFIRFLELAEAIPENRMLDTERYPWLQGYALSAVLQGSWEHHQEHLELFTAGPDSVATP